MFDLPASETTAINNFAQPNPAISVTVGTPNTDYFLLGAIPRNLDSAASFLFYQTQFRSELEELSKLPDNWDGYGAVRISPDAIERARSFLAPVIADIPGPELTPNPNGTITLEWESPSRFLHLEVGEHDYSILVGGQEISTKGIQGDGLPPMQLLRALISRFGSSEGDKNTSITAEKLLG